MTIKAHAVRLTRAQNDRVRNRANMEGTTKETSLAEVLEAIAQYGNTDTDWVVTKVSVEDEVWAKVQAVAKARGVTVSALVAGYAS